MAFTESAGQHAPVPAGGGFAGRGWIAGLRRSLDTFAQIDFTGGGAAAILAAVFLLVRLPWLWTGYGAETDAYRVALSGLHLWRDGEYLPSRLPGYPVHELLMAPLVRLGGPVATNAATALAALVGVLIFARIARESRQTNAGLVVVAFAFTPFLLVKSVETKDYLWALSFMLGAYFCANRGRPILAGVLLGLATGCRITSALFMLPLLLLFVDRRAGRAGGAFVASWALMAFLVFLPVTLQYGTGFWAYADSRISADIVIRSIGQYSIGALGALAVVSALAYSWRNLIGLPAAARADVHVRVWLLAAGCYVFAFLRLPIDIAYLIPIYPFGFLLLGRILRPYLFAAVVAAILCSGVIDLDLSAMHNLNLRTLARTARPCRSCSELFHDWHSRELYRTYATELGSAPVPPHSVVLTGGIFPDFAVLNWHRFRYGIIDRDRRSISMLSDDGMMRDAGADVLYLASPDRPSVLEGLRERGYHVYGSEPVAPHWHARVTPAP